MGIELHIKPVGIELRINPVVDQNNIANPPNPAPIGAAMQIVVENGNNNRLGQAPAGEFTLWLTIDRTLRVPLTLTAQERQAAQTQDQAIRNALAALNRDVDPDTIKWNHNFTLNHENLVFWINGEEQPPLALDTQDPRIEPIKVALRALNQIHVTKKGGPLQKHTWKTGTLAVSSGYMGDSTFKVISNKKTFREGAELAKEHLRRLGVDLNADIDRAIDKHVVLRYRTKEAIRAVEGHIAIYRNRIERLRNAPQRTAVQENQLQGYQRSLQEKENTLNALNAFLQSVEDSDGYANAMALHYKGVLARLGGLNPRNLAQLISEISRDLSGTRERIKTDRGVVERVKNYFSSAIDTSKDGEYATVIAGLVLTLSTEDLTPAGYGLNSGSEIAQRKAQFLMVNLFHGFAPPRGIDFHLASLLCGQTTHARTQIASALNMSSVLAYRFAGTFTRDHNNQLDEARQAEEAEREAATMLSRISSVLSPYIDG